MLFLKGWSSREVSLYYDIRRVQHNLSKHVNLRRKEEEKEEKEEKEEEESHRVELL
jgi:hypothetical protein